MITSQKLFVAGLLATATSAAADTDYSGLGQRAYALWDCAAFGFVAEDERAAELFELGHSKMTELLEARRDGKLTNENTKDMPMGLSWYLIDGPTIEFSLGYMWAQFSQHASDETYDQELQATFDEKKELQKLKASTGFRDKNCALLAVQ
jgi:hypothetical protein